MSTRPSSSRLSWRAPRDRRSDQQTLECPPVTGSISSFVGSSGFGHLVSSHRPPKIHSPFGSLFHLRCDTVCEFFRRCGISELNLFELCTALDEMHVCVFAESGQQQFAPRRPLLSFLA